MTTSTARTRWTAWVGGSLGLAFTRNVEAMARIGWLWRQGGEWQGERLLPAGFRPTSFAAAAGACGPASAATRAVPRGGEALRVAVVEQRRRGDQGRAAGRLLVVGVVRFVDRGDPELGPGGCGRAGKSFGEGDWRGSDYAKLAPFLRPIMKATGPPYPQSPVISKMTWAPKETIVRKAEGGDNWPLTWTEDDALFTAYGDGWGFEPHIEPKLSLGLARVTGGPSDFKGVNVRSETGEQVGQGPKGKKASGMLMVDGVLYMAVRNARNAQLAWSEDDGETWEWADWRFETSFGAPGFLNYGKNYAGARDDYVYLYSQDADSAYEAADRLVLARVPKNRVREKEAYEYFSGLEGGGPRWAPEAAERAGVLENPGRVYRSSVSYNAGLGRYMACVILARGGYAVRGRLQRLRCAGAVGSLDDGVLRRRVGRGAGRDVPLPAEVDEQGRTHGAYGLFW